jgi:hypothetical protein
MHSLGLNQTGGCVITAYDISDRGLEGVRYQVNDIENEFFSLQCGDFEFAIQEPIFEAVDQEPGLSLS